MFSVQLPPRRGRPGRGGAARRPRRRRAKDLHTWHEAVLFRNGGRAHACRVAPIDHRQRVERRMRTLLRDYGLPCPDEVRYGERCVRFLWHDRKVAVVVDLDDFDEIDADGGYSPESLTL